MTRRKRYVSLAVASLLAVTAFMPYGLKIWYVVGQERADFNLPAPRGYCAIAWYDPRDIVARWLGGMALIAGDSEVVGWFVGCGPEARGSLVKLGLDHYAIYIDGSRQAMLKNVSRDELIAAFAAPPGSAALSSLSDAAASLAVDRRAFNIPVALQDGDVAGYIASMSAARVDEAAAEVHEVDLMVQGLTRLRDRPIMLMTALPNIPVAGTESVSLEALVAELIEIQRDAMRRLVAAN